MAPSFASHHFSCFASLTKNNSCFFQYNHAQSGRFQVSFGFSKETYFRDRRKLPCCSTMLELLHCVSCLHQHWIRLSYIERCDVLYTLYTLNEFNEYHIGYNMMSEPERLLHLAYVRAAFGSALHYIPRLRCTYDLNVRRCT